MRNLVVSVAIALLLGSASAQVQIDPHADHAVPAVAAAPDPNVPPNPSIIPVSDNIPPTGERADERLAGSPRRAGWVSIEMAGGPPQRTWVVYPDRQDRAPVVIVIHEIFGLTSWIRAVADQLAKDGFVALAPDLLSGKGPNGGGTDSLPPEEARRLVGAMTPAEVAARLNAVRAWAVALPESDGHSGVVGFCWGGGSSFNYGVAQPALDAAIVYYGTNPAPAAIADLQVPVLGLYGGNDARVNATIPPAKAEADRLGKVYEFDIYPGAGHAFLRQQMAQQGANFRATVLAWPRTLDFLRYHLR